MNSVCIVQLVSGMWLALLCQIMGHIIKTSKPSKYNSFSSNSYTISIVFQLLGGDSQFFTIRPEILSCRSLHSSCVYLQLVCIHILTSQVVSGKYYKLKVTKHHWHLQSICPYFSKDSWALLEDMDVQFGVEQDRLFLLCILTSPDTGWELLWSMIIQIAHWKFFNTVPISQCNNVEISLSTYDISSQRLFAPWVVPISLCR